MYNKNNIFYKIINRELPCNLVYEDESIMCFHDIKKDAPIHVLAITKGHYVDFSDFTLNASPEDVSYFFMKIREVAQNVLNLNHFKILTNNGPEAGQVVFHFHVHILGYKQL